MVELEREDCAVQNCGRISQNVSEPSAYGSASQKLILQELGSSNLRGNVDVTRHFYPVASERRVASIVPVSYRGKSLLRGNDTVY